MAGEVPGTNTCAVTISVPGASPQAIAVTFTVNAQPSIVLSAAGTPAVNAQVQVVALNFTSNTATIAVK